MSGKVIPVSCWDFPKPKQHFIMQGSSEKPSATTLPQLPQKSCTNPHQASSENSLWSDQGCIYISWHTAVSWVLTVLLHDTKLSMVSTGGAIHEDDNVVIHKPLPSPSTGISITTAGGSSHSLSVALTSRKSKEVCNWHCTCWYKK